MKQETTDRLPPYAPTAERGVLGCILTDPVQCLPICIERLNGCEMFYDLRHQTLYETMVAMFNRREPVDDITLTQALTQNQMLENLGGVSFLAELRDSVPSAANLDYYIGYVEEKFQLRKMVQACTDAVADIYEGGDTEQIIDAVETKVLKAAEIRTKKELPSIKKLVHRAVDGIQFRFDNQGKITGLHTGIADLDKMTDGLHAGEVWVIAARPSMGKTSIAMGIAEHVALEHQIPVGVFSLEMSAESLVTRMICSLARVNLMLINRGIICDTDFSKISHAAARISESKLFVDDTAGLSILQLRARARRMYQQHDIKLFVIDYLQLLNSTARRSQENRQQEIADISSGIKAMAKELNVPVIVLAQLNREIEKDKSRKPRLSDLRESGSIEQDADLVGLLYKPGATEAEQNDESDAIAVNLLVAKQRNGPTGDVHLTFLKPYTRFESAAPEIPQEATESRQPHAD